MTGTADDTRQKNSSLTFEEITVAIVKQTSFHRAKVCPIRDTRDKKAKTARQIIFRIEISSKHCDLFYNSRDGLRGRYWLSPDVGFLSTKDFIEAYSVARTTPTIAAGTEPMSVNEIKASLQAPSAKVWPYEYKGKSIHRLRGQATNRRAALVWC